MTLNKTLLAKPAIQIDNSRTIVTRWSFRPAAETGWHCHNYDYVIVPNTNGRLKIETQQGSDIVELEIGESYFRSAGVEHNVINVNNFAFSFVEIELK